MERAVTLYHDVAASEANFFALLLPEGVSWSRGKTSVAVGKGAEQIRNFNWKVSCTRSARSFRGSEKLRL